jgi:WD40 repeat protein
VAAVGAARAADPQPLWEIDTTAEKLRPRWPTWVGFSPDDKVLVARVEYTPQRKPDQADLTVPERVLAWDAKTRKGQFNLELGSSRTQPTGRQRLAFTENGTILVPGEVAREVRLTDGNATKMADVPKDTVGVWLDVKSRRTVWDRAKGYDDLGFALGQLSIVEGFGPRADAKWQTIPLIVRPETFETLTLSPDQKQVAAAVQPNLGSDDGTLRLLSLGHGDKLALEETVRVTHAHRSFVAKMEFSPDGRTLAVGGSDASVSLWDVTKAGKDWKPFATIPTGNGIAMCLAFSPDARTLAAGTTDRKGRSNLFLIDVAGGKLVSSRAAGEQEVTAVAYSADGKLLVTGHSGGKVRVWEAAAVRGD